MTELERKEKRMAGKMNSTIATAEGRRKRLRELERNIRLCRQYKKHVERNLKGNEREGWLKKYDALIERYKKRIFEIMHAGRRKEVVPVLVAAAALLAMFVLAPHYGLFTGAAFFENATNFTSGSGIIANDSVNDVFIYDCNDDGSCNDNWRTNSSLSWWNNSAFPNITYHICSQGGYDIIDASNNTLWERARTEAITACAAIDGKIYWSNATATAYRDYRNDINATILYQNSSNDIMAYNATDVILATTAGAVHVIDGHRVAYDTGQANAVYLDDSAAYYGNSTALGRSNHTAINISDTVVKDYLDLDGDGDFGQLAYDSSFHALENLTVMGWAKLKNAGGGYIAARTNNGATARVWTLYITGTDKVGIRMNNASGSEFTAAGSTTLNAGQWYHAAFTYNGTEALAYLNGVNEVNKTIGTALNDQQRAIWVGLGPLNAYANISIDELMIYNRTLSDDEILDAYTSGTEHLTSNVSDDKLLIHWNFDGHTKNQAGINAELDIRDNAFIGFKGDIEGTIGLDNTTVLDKAGGRIFAGTNGQGAVIVNASTFALEGTNYSTSYGTIAGTSDNVTGIGITDDNSTLYLSTSDGSDNGGITEINISNSVSTRNWTSATGGLIDYDITSLSVSGDGPVTNNDTAGRIIAGTTAGATGILWNSTLVAYLEEPADGNDTVDFEDDVIFTCSAGSNNELANITLYHNLYMTFSENGTVDVSGTSASATFTRSITESNAFVDTGAVWNCLAEDDTGLQRFADENYSFSSFGFGTMSDLSTDSLGHIALDGNTQSYLNMSGTFTSRIFDAGQTVVWDNMTWSEQAMEKSAVLNTDSHSISNDTVSSVSTYICTEDGSCGSAWRGNSSTRWWQDANNTLVDRYFDVIAKSGDYINVTDPSGLPLGNTNRSLTFWFKLRNCPSATTSDVIWAYGNNSAGQAMNILINATSNTLALGRSGEAFEGTTDLCNSLGVWKHGAITYNATDTKTSIYIDGTLDNSGLLSGVDTVNRALTIGANTQIGEFYNGSIDELRIYNRTISADEVLNGYSRGASKLHDNTSSDGLVGEWLFEGDAIDEMKINNGTFIGGAFTTLRSSTTDFPNMTYSICTDGGYDIVDASNDMFWARYAGGAINDCFGYGGKTYYSNSTGTYYKDFANDVNLTTVISTESKKLSHHLGNISIGTISGLSFINGAIVNNASTGETTAAAMDSSTLVWANATHVMMENSYPSADFTPDNSTALAGINALAMDSIYVYAGTEDSGIILLDKASFSESGIRYNVSNGVLGGNSDNVSGVMVISNNTLLAGTNGQGALSKIDTAGNTLLEYWNMSTTLAVANSSITAVAGNSHDHIAGSEAGVTRLWFTDTAFAVRPCRQPDCSDTNLSGEYSNNSYANISTNNASRYFQYEASLSTGNINATPSLWNITIKYFTDTETPSITIHEPSNIYHNSSITVNVTATDNHIVGNVSYRLENASYNGSWEALSNAGSSYYNASIDIGSYNDSNYTLRINATDSTGNSNSTETVKSVVIDTMTPGINLTYPLNGTRISALYGNITFNWTLEEDNPETCLYDMNGTNATTSCTQLSETFNVSSGATYNLTLWINDSIGNSNSSSITFTTGIPPTVPEIVWPTGNISKVYTNITFQWNASTDEDGDSITYNIAIANDSEFSNAYINDTTDSTNYTNLSTVDGPHYWKVRAYDGIEYSNYSETGLVSVIRPTIDITTFSAGQVVYPGSFYSISIEETERTDWISNVTVLVLGDGQENVTQADNLSGTIWQANYTVPLSLSPRELTVVATAYNDSGESINDTVTILLTRPQGSAVTSPRINTLYAHPTYQQPNQTVNISLISSLDTLVGSIVANITMPNGTVESITADSSSDNSSILQYERNYTYNATAEGAYSLTAFVTDINDQVTNRSATFHARSLVAVNASATGATNLKVYDVGSGFLIMENSTIDTSLPPGQYDIEVSTAKPTIAVRNVTLNGTSDDFIEYADISETTTPPTNRRAVETFEVSANTNYSNVTIEFNYSDIEASLIDEDNLEIWKCDSLDSCEFSELSSSVNTSENTVSTTITTLSVFMVAEPTSLTEGSSSGTTGGGGASSTTITQKVSLDIIATGYVAMYGNDEVVVPVIIKNTGDLGLSTIMIDAETDTDDLSLAITRDSIPYLSRGGQESAKLIITSHTEPQKYEVVLNARSQSPQASDTSKIVVELMDRNAGNKSDVSSRMSFAKNLFNQNPECLELSELIQQAEGSLAKEEYAKAKSLIEAAVDGCRELIGLSERPSLESPGAVRKVTGDIYRFWREKIQLNIVAVIAILTGTIIALFLVLNIILAARKK